MCVCDYITCFFFVLRDKNLLENMNCMQKVRLCVLGVVYLRIWFFLRNWNFLGEPIKGQNIKSKNICLPSAAKVTSTSVSLCKSVENTDIKFGWWLFQRKQNCCTDIIILTQFIYHNICLFFFSTSLIILNKFSIFYFLLDMEKTSYLIKQKNIYT